MKTTELNSLELSELAFDEARSISGGIWSPVSAWRLVFEFIGAAAVLDEAIDGITDGWNSVK